MDKDKFLKWLDNTCIELDGLISSCPSDIVYNVGKLSLAQKILDNLEDGYFDKEVEKTIYFVHVGIFIVKVDKSDFFKLVNDLKGSIFFTVLDPVYNEKCEFFEWYYIEKGEKILFGISLQ